MAIKETCHRKSWGLVLSGLRASQVLNLVFKRLRAEELDQLFPSQALCPCCPGVGEDHYLTMSEGLTHPDVSSPDIYQAPVMC